MSTAALIDSLKLGVRELLGSQAQRVSSSVLGDELGIYQLITIMQDGSSEAFLRKLAFCNMLLAIFNWKNSPGDEPLPNLLLTSYQMKDGYLILSPNNSGQAKSILDSFKPEIETKSSSNGTVMLFAPVKYINEKRLYSLTVESISRIVDMNNWDKLIDPNMCHCWVKLPALYSSKLARKPTLEIFDTAVPSDGSQILARKMLSRKNTRNKSSKSNLSTGCTKVSIFKRNLISSAASKLNDESAGELPSPLRDLDISSFKNTWSSEASKLVNMGRTN